MALTDSEKVRARHHLGYVNVSAVQTFVLGVPAAVQTEFMIEGALNKVLDEAEELVREHLRELDEIDCQLKSNKGNVEFSSAEEVTINPKAYEKLRQRYLHWQGSLGNLLGVIPNPYDMRFGGRGGGYGINIGVMS